MRENRNSSKDTPSVTYQPLSSARWPYPSLNKELCLSELTYLSFIPRWYCKMTVFKTFLPVLYIIVSFFFEHKLCFSHFYFTSMQMRIEPEHGTKADQETQVYIHNFTFISFGKSMNHHWLVILLMV